MKQKLLIGAAVLALVGGVFFWLKSKRSARAVQETVATIGGAANMKDSIIQYVHSLPGEFKGQWRDSEILAVIDQESSFNPAARSGGHVGLGQMYQASLTDANGITGDRTTWTEYTEDWRKQLRACVGYLRWCYRAASGQKKKALMYYRAGYGCIEGTSACWVPDGKQIASAYADKIMLKAQAYEN